MEIRTVFLLPLIGSLHHNVKGCLDNWINYGDVCLSVERTSNPEGFPTVFDAQMHCASLGAEIGSLETREKNNFMYQHLRSQRPRPNRVFIGLNDIYHENQFEWPSGAPVNYTFWGHTEPNNNFRGDEDCVVVESDDNQWLLDGDTSWRDYPCCVITSIDAVLCQRGLKYSPPYTILTSPFAKTCGIVLSCPPVPTWNGILPDTTERLVDTVVNYTCEEGLVLDGSTETFATTLCNITGEWFPEFGTCALTPSERRTALQHEPVEAEGAVAIGTTGLIVMLIELGVIILVDSDHLKAHACMCGRNILYLHKRFLSPNRGPHPSRSQAANTPVEEVELV